MPPCTSCGRSTVGIGLDGKPYCEVKACCDWKTVVQAVRSLRDLAHWKATGLIRSAERFARVAA